MASQTGYGVTLTATGLVANVVTITPAQAKISSIQTSNLTSDDQAHTFIAGMEDAGEISFTCNFTTAGFAALNTIADARTESAFEIDIPSPNALTITCNGFITSRGVDSISMDGVITATFTVKCSGLVY